jgi:hypothetical protein
MWGFFSLFPPPPPPPPLPRLSVGQLFCAIFLIEFLGVDVSRFATLRGVKKNVIKKNRELFSTAAKKGTCLLTYITPPTPVAPRPRARPPCPLPLARRAEGGGRRAESGERRAAEGRGSQGEGCLLTFNFVTCEAFLFLSPATPSMNRRSNSALDSGSDSLLVSSIDSPDSASQPRPRTRTTPVPTSGSTTPAGCCWVSPHYKVPNPAKYTLHMRVGFAQVRIRGGWREFFR